MSGIGVNLRVTGHCCQGGRKYMEDMFSVAYQQTVDLKDLEYAFFGIFDGHGGPQAATFAKENLLDSIVSQKSFWSNDDQEVLNAIREGYLTTHYNMWKDVEKWPKTSTGLPSTSGSTASVAFIMKGKIYIGHVGDTAIVLGYQEEGEKDWKAKVLTKDHKPESREEKQRIHESGGKVVIKSGVPRVVWNRPRLGHQGPVRRSTPIDEIPFLAVARSLGDFWSYNSALDQFVVSPEPDVFVYPVDVKRCRCLLLGTDGLWNMMTPERSVAIVQSTEIHNEKQVLYGLNSQYNKEWQNPSKALVDHALERWMTTKLRADNTSVVTLLLDPPGPPRAQVLLKQWNKMKGVETTSDEESKFSVPKSGAIAIFTHYPSSDDLKSKVKDEMIIDDAVKGYVKVNRHPLTSDIVTKESGQNEPQHKLHSDNHKSSEGEKGVSLNVSSVSPFKCSSSLLPCSRVEDQSCVVEEEPSSDTENERVFPDSETKKRRLSFDKKSVKPRTGLRRPSLPALNGKTTSLCKARSLEESTRMLRSATPIKTLRSRNIDLSNSPSMSSKRARAPSPLLAKKQRLEEQMPPLVKRKVPNKPTDLESPKSNFLKSFLESDEGDLFCDSKNPVLSNVSFSKKDSLKDRKHKSISPMLNKWHNSSSARSKDPLKSISDSDLSPMLTAFASNRRLRLPTCGRRPKSLTSTLNRSSATNQDLDK